MTSAVAVPSKITSIRKKTYSGKVFNLEVEGSNSYVANGVAVHNCANIWYHGLTPKGKKRVKKRGMSESEHVIAEAVVAEMIADEPELDEELTKQHFIRIASILKPHTRTPAGERIAGDLADFFAGENPRFDRDRFLKAAGVGAERERLAASADEDHRDDDDDEEPKRGQRLGRLTIPWDDDPELGGREV